MSHTTDEPVPSAPPEPPAGSPPPSAPTPGEPPPPSSLAAKTEGGFLEWLWRGAALREASSRVRQLAPARQEALRLAEIAAEIGARALDPVDPLRAGAGDVSAARAFVDALLFASASLEDAWPADGDSVAARLREPLVAALGPERAADALAAMGMDARALTALGVVERRRAAELLRDAAVAAIARADGGRAAVRALTLSRFARTLLVVAILGTFLGGAGALLARKLSPKDIAAGKPWRASSAYVGYQTSGRTSDARATDVPLFHTKEEESPWMDVDLGAVTAIKGVTVRNRRDCCGERAAPLVVEVSNDGQAFRQVARRDDAFSTWSVSFKESARFVRVRAPRRTMLHLDAVLVHLPTRSPVSLYDRILGTPFVYNRVRPLVVGGIDMSRVYARLGADRSSSILDVGCGTGDALRYIDVYERYLGVDTDPVAVRFAESRFGGRPATRFEARVLDARDVAELAPSHVILAGLLHHLTDDECVGLFEMVSASPRLRRIVTQDIVYLPGAPINNFFASMDRGQYCRPSHAYGALAERAGLTVVSAEALLSHPKNPLGVRYWVMTLEPSRAT